MSRRTPRTQTTKSGTSENSPSVALNSPTPEDLALDRELDRIAKESPSVDDAGPAPLRVLKEGELLTLADVVEGYTPAKTIEQLDMHVHEAKAHGAESTEADDSVFKRLLGPHALDASFIYKNLRVYRAGVRESVMASEKMDIESKVFGKSAK